jgi:hypothetical protein
MKKELQAIKYYLSYEFGAGPMKLVWRVLLVSTFVLGILVGTNLF